MKVLKNKTFAWCAAIIIILGSILFGAHRSLQKRADKVEALFENGVYDSSEKYTQPSISSQLAKCEGAALGLLTIANEYSLTNQADELRQARQALMEAETITAKYSANERLKSAFDTVTVALGKVSLESNDASSVEDYTSIFNGAQGVIEKSLYNKEVGKYMNSVQSGFPAALLGAITGVDKPDYFK